MVGKCAKREKVFGIMVPGWVESWLWVGSPVWWDAGGGVGGDADGTAAGQRSSGGMMDRSLLAVLNQTERLLVAETEPAALVALDEDAALDLEARIRRARDKYDSQYRRT